MEDHITTDELAFLDGTINVGLFHQGRPLEPRYRDALMQTRLFNLVDTYPLAQYHQALEKVHRFHLCILAVTKRHLDRALTLSAKYGDETCFALLVAPEHDRAHLGCRVRDAKVAWVHSEDAALLTQSSLCYLLNTTLRNILAPHPAFIDYRAFKDIALGALYQYNPRTVREWSSFAGIPYSSFRRIWETQCRISPSVSLTIWEIYTRAFTAVVHRFSAYGHIPKLPWPDTSYRHDTKEHEKSFRTDRDGILPALVCQTVSGRPRTVECRHGHPRCDGTLGV
jgi:hypothetical protein